MCGAGEADVARALLSARADVHWRSKRGLTLLHIAVDNGALATACVLLDGGADVNARTTKHANTPLHIAAVETRAAHGALDCHTVHLFPSVHC